MSGNKLLTNKSTTMIYASKAYHDTLEKVSQKNAVFFSQVYKAIEEAIEEGKFEVLFVPDGKFTWSNGLSKKLHHLGYSPVFNTYGDDTIKSVELHWSNPKTNHITL